VLVQIYGLYLKLLEKPIISGQLNPKILLFYLYNFLEPIKIFIQPFQTPTKKSKSDTKQQPKATRKNSY
jgi:hypothetical protein